MMTRTLIFDDHSKQTIKTDIARMILTKLNIIDQENWTLMKEDYIGDSR